MNEIRTFLRRHEQAGQAMLEFILILPLMLVIGAAIWEYGRIFAAQNVLTDSAREGARYANIYWDSYLTSGSSTPNADFVNAVKTVVTQNLQNSYGQRLVSATNPNGDVTVTNISVVCEDDSSGTPFSNQSTSCPQANARLAVQVDGTIKIFAPFVPGLTSGSSGSTFNIHAIATMRLSGN